MKRIKILLVICLIITVSLTTITYSATLDEIRELERQQEELLQSIEGGEEKIAELEATIAEIDERIRELDVQISNKKNTISGLEIDKEIKEEEIKVTSLELEVAIKEENDYKDKILNRITVMYEYGESSYFQILLESENIGDFFNRLEYLTKILKHDEHMLDNLQSINEEIESKETLLEIENVVLEDIIQMTKSEEKVLEDLSVAKRIEMDRVQSDKELHTLQNIEWEEEQNSIDSLIEELKIELKYQFQDGDTFSWPTPGYYTITSPFGMRIHPTTGIYSMHSGTDIGAPMGSDIIAAATGVVIMSQYYGSYGNLVIIDHGGGYLTYYGHISTLLVDVGDEVARGDRIALIGTTGRSTGPHLHFSVKIDGEWANPMDYFE